MSIAAAFLGCDHRVGTSMLCQSAAEYIAEKYPEKNVLIFHAEGSMGTEYSPEASESITQIRPYLTQELIDAESICAKAKWKRNIYVIAGPDVPGKSSEFFPGMSEYLIMALKKRFDYILCDCGADIEHGLTLGALDASDKIYMVINQSEHAVRRFEWTRPLYGFLGLNPDGIVVNMFERSSPYSMAYIKSRLGLEETPVYPVKRSSDGQKAETDGKSLYRLGDRGFCKAVALLAGDIVNEF